MDLKFGEFVGLEILSSQDESHYMLRQKSKGSEVEDLVAVLVDEIENLGVSK